MDEMHSEITTDISEWVKFVQPTYKLEDERNLYLENNNSSNIIEFKFCHDGNGPGPIQRAISMDFFKGNDNSRPFKQEDCVTECPVISEKEVHAFVEVPVISEVKLEYSFTPHQNSLSPTAEDFAVKSPERSEETFNLSDKSGAPACKVPEHRLIGNQNSFPIISDYETENHDESKIMSQLFGGFRDALTTELYVVDEGSRDGILLTEKSDEIEESGQLDCVTPETLIKLKNSSGPSKRKQADIRDKGFYNKRLCSERKDNVYPKSSTPNKEQRGQSTNFLKCRTTLKQTPRKKPYSMKVVKQPSSRCQRLIGKPRPNPNTTWSSLFKKRSVKLPPGFITPSNLTLFKTNLYRKRLSHEARVVCRHGYSLRPTDSRLLKCVIILKKRD